MYKICVLYFIRHIYVIFYLFCCIGLILLKEMYGLFWNMHTNVDMRPEWKKKVYLPYWLSLSCELMKKLTFMLNSELKSLFLSW